MMLLYVKNTKINLLLNAILVFQLTFVFLLINANISEIYYRKNVNYYLNDTSSRLYLLSGAVKNNIELGDNDSFEILISAIESEGSVSAGYHIEESIIMEKNESQIVPCFYLNTVMVEIKYKLQSGRWFTNSDNSICEIIIGGDISRNYKINEEVTLYQGVYHDNNVTYKQIEAVVIGILDSPSQVIDLGYVSNYPTYNNLFNEYDRVILTNNETVINSDFLRYPLGSIMICDNNENGLFYDEISKYGQIFSFDEINEYSTKTYEQIVKSELIPNLMIVIMVIFGMVGVTYLYTYKNMKNISVLILCGMSKRMCINLILTNSIIVIILSSLLAYMLYHEENIHDILFSKSLIGWWNIVGNISIIFIFIIVSVTCANVFSNKSILNMIRRFE